MTAAIQHLAQLNIGRVRHALDDPRMADFMNNLARVNALAERSPGYVWRYADASGNATDTRPFADDPRMIINMSVWENAEALQKFVWQTVHRRFYARKHEWFEKLEGPYFVLWHVAAGHRPGVEEAIARLDHLKTHGPSDYAFGWQDVATAKPSETGGSCFEHVGAATE
jgi:heme-degrading monooxygenase HmoA